MVTRHGTTGYARARLTWYWIVTAALAAPAAILAAPSAATAAGHGLPAGCVASGANVTCTYGPVGHEQAFVVPLHVSSVHVTVTGAAGAPSGFGGAAGGHGAVVTSTLSVGGLTDLFVEVGGNATGSTQTLACLGGTLCTGGWNGGGGGGTSGGGGGGASDIRTISNSGAGTLGSRVLVAGGGGGGGANSILTCSDGTTLAAGGRGGNASTNGAAAAFCPTETGTSTGGRSGDNGGGGGHTAVAGGSTTNGDPGSTGLGGSADGTADEVDQGGGGAGLIGGGTGADIGLNDGDDAATGASGGGGGSSLVLPGGSFAISTLTAGSVLISYSQNPDHADLGIKIRGPRSAAAGSRFSEALVVTNYGPAVALDVTTTASLPRHLNVITASGLVRHVNDGLRWTDPALHPGESVTYRITFGVAPAVNARVSLRGTTAATGSPDPNTNNNNAIAGIRLHAVR